MMSLRKTRAHRVLRQILKTPITAQQTLTVHVGVVVTTSPLTIYLDGDTSEAVSAHLWSTYTPSVDDVVRVFNIGGVLEVADAFVS